MRPASVLPVTEKDWARTVVEYAELMGWRTYAAWLSIRSPAGYPDLTLVRERVVWVELKAEKGKQTQAQLDWQRALLQAGAEWHIWRPSDWDEVQRVLGRAVSRSGGEACRCTGGDPQLRAALDDPVVMWRHTGRCPLADEPASAR